ncbi:MAG: hypothetical protein J0M33_04595 [Anaerolineae bacterium]|nr:hypothetical protein [Anaerolineae bacterium]
MSIFYNIHGQFVKDPAYLMALVAAQQPRWALVMDHSALASRLLDSSPTTNIVHRTYRDDGYWTSHNPDEWLNFHRATYDDPRLWHYTDNEVGIQAEWHLEAIEKNARAARPLKMVIGNTSTGSPGWDEWQTPLARQLLERAAQYREWCVLGVHEYFMGVPTAGLQGMVAETDVSRWPDARNDALPDYHLGRWRRTQMPGLRVVITEYGSDSLADLHARWMKIEGGWKPAESHWRSWYPALSLEQAYYMCLWYGWQMAYAQSQVEGALIFSYGSDPHSAGTGKDWTRFDVEPLCGLHDLIRENATPVGLERMGAALPSKPSPTSFQSLHIQQPLKPPFEPRTLRLHFPTGLTTLNLLDAPGTGSLVTSLGDGQEVRLIAEQEVDGTFWYQAKIGFFSGWFAVQFTEGRIGLGDEPVPASPPPVPVARLELILPLPADLSAAGKALLGQVLQNLADQVIAGNTMLPTVTLPADATPETAEAISKVLQGVEVRVVDS